MVDIDLAALIVTLISLRVSLSSRVDRMLFKWLVVTLISFTNWSRFSCVWSNWSIELTTFSIKFSWFDSFKSWLIVLAIFERLDSCLPVIVSPWQIINLVSHFSDVGFAIFLGMALSLVSKATWTSPPRKEFVTTLANVGLGRIISGLFKTIFALIYSLVNKISSIDPTKIPL